MVTTTLKETNNNDKAHRLSGICKAVCLGIVLLNSSAMANELRVTASVSTDIVTQNLDSQNNPNNTVEDVDTFQVIPQVNAEYRTRTFQGRLTGKYSYLDRKFDETDRTDNFGEYQYSAIWSPIGEVLTLSANGGLNYQNVSNNGALINDFLLNGAELAKSRNNNYAATLRIPNTPWFQAQGTLRYSDTRAEESEFLPNSNLNNESLSAQGSIRNPDDANYFFWQVDGTYQKTQRTQLNQGDFITRSGLGVFDWLVFENIALNATIRHEANQISDTDNVFSQGREFNSYGAGLTYRQSDNRFVTLTVNTSESAIESNDGDTFIGVQVNWAFSPRTAFSGEYGKRFYGDAGRASLTYNRKRLRSQISYSEEVTSFSRLVSNPENLGVFVCSDGIVDLSACFQPSSLEYQLQAGEDFIQFSTVSTDINDEVVLRKSLNAQLGFQGRRTNVSLSAQHARNESVEISRQQRTYSIGLQASYQLGRRTSLSSQVTYTDVSQRSETLLNGDNKSWLGSITFTRDLGRSLSTNLSFQYTDRDGDLNVGLGVLTDRRVSLGLTYRYE